MAQLFDDGAGTAAELIPDEPTMASLREAAAGCTACDLYQDATQTVFGEGVEGPREADVVLVGEQPGDQEDRRGRPFVGPAGELLDRALVDAGIDRQRAYVTNVVKHFKFTQRGKRRIHGKPNAEQITACKPWLTAELAVLQPRVVVLLGATAAQAILGPSFRVTRQRGDVFDRTSRAGNPVKLTATVHPSSILRTPDERRDAAYADFVDDLRMVAGLLR